MIHAIAGPARLPSDHGEGLHGQSGSAPDPAIGERERQREEGVVIEQRVERVARPPSLAGNLGFLLARAGGNAVRSLNRGLGDTGLRHKHYTILMALRDRDRMSQRELAAILDVDPSAVVALLDDLVRLSLVRRDPHPMDRRTHEIAFTEVGRAEAERIAELGADIQQEMFASLSAKEIEALIALLGRATGIIED